MKTGHLCSLMLTNADGRSRFRLHAGNSRYRLGEVSHPDVFFKQFGIIDMNSMTMPVFAADDIEYEHMCDQLSKIAMGILNGHVASPAEMVDPERFRVGPHRLNDGSMLFAITDHFPPEVPCDMSPIHQLFYAPPGLPEQPYFQGREEIEKIAAAMCANGFSYRMNTMAQQIERHRVADLPSWIGD